MAEKKVGFGRCVRYSRPVFDGSPAPGEAPVNEAHTSELQEWIRRTNLGDPQARAELLGHTRDRLARIARRMLHGPHARLEVLEQTDDVVQELYVRLLERWHSFFEQPQPVASVSDYFFRAAGMMRNLLIDLGRKHFGRQAQRQRPLPLEAGGEAAAGAGPGNEPAADADDPADLSFWTEFHQEVERLPEGLRAVVDLRWYHDLTHPEIAALLGVAEVTVRGRWAKARLELQARFEGSPFDWSSFR
jgi:RNA polymerase sigma factor (sigma-70 family)